MAESKTPTKQHNTIRSFALICVAITSLFIMAMRIWGTQILRDGQWCDRAIGAVADAKMGRSIEAIGACFNLLDTQLKAVAWNSHIDSFVIGLCLLSLMVIVVAGGQLNFSVSKSGASGSLGRSGDDLPERAQGAVQVADAAAEAAEEVVEEETGAPKPKPKPQATDVLE